MTKHNGEMGICANYQCVGLDLLLMLVWRLLILEPLSFSLLLV
jgi:hypothetical protein